MTEARCADQGGLGRQLLALLATTVIGFGASVGAALGADLNVGPTASSRAASDRPCPTLAEIPRHDRLVGLRLHARRVGDAQEPAALALDPRMAGRGVLGERAGRLLRVEGGEVTDEVVLDLRADTADVGDGGLLGAAYDPDGGWLYVYRTDATFDDVLTAHRLDEGGRPTGGPGRVVLHVDRPVSLQHHGGSLVFGRDRMLYVGFGDGGGLGDPDEHAQDPSTLLGKVLRIDPTPAAARPYAVPADNPFLDHLGWRPEIWVLGVRNPFRMSLDDATGDLWLGDPGQSCWEEVDRLPTGADGAGGSNLGWDRLEGDEPFEGGTVPGVELRPTYTYAHESGGCAIVTGYVLRDPALPQLDGSLLHADHCRGRLLALRVDDGRAAGHDPTVIDLGIEIERPAAIVSGPNGRPWVLSLEGGIYELASG